jgi:hypothetical protein
VQYRASQLQNDRKRQPRGNGTQTDCRAHCEPVSGRNPTGLLAGHWK